MTNSIRLSLLSLGLLASAGLVSCTPGERGALIGGALGAGTGALVGDGTGALVGGAVGAIAGSEISKNRAARNHYYHNQGGYGGPGYGPPPGAGYGPPPGYYHKGYGGRPPRRGGYRGY